MATRARRVWLAATGAVVLLALAAVPVARRHLEAALVLLSAVGAEDTTGLTDWVREPVDEQELTLTGGARPLRARLYSPRGVASPRGAVVFHGVHPRGIDEPRFMAFARGLSASGRAVLTPELPELAAHRVETATLDDMVQSARALAERLSRPAVGAYGISFAGGLLLLAASQQAKPFSHLVAVGAHHDLSRLAAYYAGREVRGPDGEAPGVPPHPYGARVIIRAHADRLFGPADRPVAEQVLELWLSGQHAAARRRERELGDEGRALMAAVLDDRRHAEMGEHLMAAVEQNAETLARLSPAGSLAALRVPTYLVHGRDDPVIPSLETRWLAREVPASALRGVLVTPVLAHTDLDATPGVVEHWKVVHMVARMLDEP